jgi:hypothetical protein
MKDLDLKIQLKKNKTLFARVEDKIYTQVEILAQKHKVEKSVVVRSLIEAGLRTIK